MNRAHSERSLAPIDAGDLLRLAGIAAGVEAGLSDRSLKAITDMIDSARTVEGLPDDAAPASS